MKVPGSVEHFVSSHTDSRSHKYSRILFNAAAFCSRRLQRLAAVEEPAAVEGRGAVSRCCAASSTRFFTGRRGRTAAVLREAQRRPRTLPPLSACVLALARMPSPERAIRSRSPPSRLLGGGSNPAGVLSLSPGARVVHREHRERDVSRAVVVDTEHYDVR